MKKILLVFVFISVLHESKAQPIKDTLSCFSNAYIDTVYTLCDTVYNPNFVINVEPSANNIWQTGKTYKFGTNNARDTSCAIFTDSINPYPINNYSAFNFRLPKNVGQFASSTLYNYYLKFWHKFDTDSFLDGCWLETSTDSGLTWEKIDNNWGWMGIGSCHLYNNSLQSNDQDSLLDGTKAWSGNSQGWRYTAFWLNMAIPVKPGRGNEVNAVRFVFKSDSIQTNKAGWIIDDLAVGWIDIGSSISETKYINQLPIFPNPSQTGTFNISFPSQYVKGQIEIYNQMGQKLLQLPLKSELDLSQFSNGLYFYRTSFDGKVYSGYLQKN